MHYYVIVPDYNTEVWAPSKEIAIGTMNAYHKMGVVSADYIEVEYDHQVDIPF